MADQKISELQLVVATGVAATGIYVPLYTPMLAPANRRISAAEFFKTPKRIEVSDSALAGTGEVMTLTTSYGTASLRVGTGGQFILGGNLAAIGEVAVVSDSSALKLGISSDVGFLRTASGVARVIDVSTSNYGALEAKRFAATYGVASGANVPIISGSQTWSDASTVFTAALINVVDTNSNAASKLLDLQVGGSSLSFFRKTGTLAVATPASYGLSVGNIEGRSGFSFWNAGESMSLWAQGSDKVLLSNGSVTIGAGWGLGFESATTGSPDLSLARTAADRLALRRGANAQRFEVYRTYTDASTYERGVAGFYDSSSDNGSATSTFRIGTEKGSVGGTAQACSFIAGGIDRVNIPAASGSAVTITSYDFSQGNILALTSPSGTAAIRVGAGGRLVNVGDFSSVGEIAVVSDSSALKLGLASDVGLVRSASGVARVTDISTSNYGALEAKRFIGTFGAAAGSSQPMVSGSQTWNDGAVTFVGVGFNITDNGSNALSRALDIQVNGSGVLSVQKNGTVTTNYYTTSAAASAGLYARSNTGLVAFGLSDDAVITRDAADVIAQRRATNAQNFRVYNSYISAGVNEYLNLGFSSSSVAQLGTLRNGSGIVRNLDIMSSGIPRITVPASHNTAVSVSGSLNVSGTFTGLTSPGLAVAQTWNNATTDFTALTVDIIPQNAGNSSNFIEFKSSGTSYAKLTQFGDFQSSSFTPADLGTRMGSSGIKIGTAAQYTFVNSTSAASSAIAAGLTLGGSGVVKVTNGFADTGSITVRNVNSTVFTITDATGVDINPASGAIQVWTLGATRTPSANNFAAGQSVTLMVDDGSAFSINWGTMGVSWLNSTPPALPTSGYGVIELWKVGSTIYGTSVGNVV